MMLLPRYDSATSTILGHVTLLPHVVGFVVVFALLNFLAALFSRATRSVAYVPPVRLIASARHLHRIFMRLASIFTDPSPARIYVESVNGASRAGKRGSTEATAVPLT